LPAVIFSSDINGNGYRPLNFPEVSSASPTFLAILSKCSDEPPSKDDFRVKLNDTKEMWNLYALAKFFNSAANSLASALLILIQGSEFLISAAVSFVLFI
jgi:hypothetical protein